MLTREELEQLGIVKLRAIARGLDIPGTHKWTKTDKENAIEAILNAPRKESDPEAIRAVRAKVDEIVVLLKNIDPSEHAILLAPLAKNAPRIVKQQQSIFAGIDDTSPLELAYIPPMDEIVPPIDEIVPQMDHDVSPLRIPSLEAPLDTEFVAVTNKGSLNDYVEEHQIDIEIPLYYRQMELDFRLAIPSAGVHKVKGDEDLNIVLKDVQKTSEETRVSFPDVEYNIRKCLGLT